MEIFNIDEVQQVLDEVYDYVEEEQRWSVEWDVTATNPLQCDEDELQAAREVEIERLQRFKVKVSFRPGDKLWDKLKDMGWNGQVHEMRWVDVHRPDGLRSRIVGKEYANSTEFGLFASTPDGVVLHYILSDAASDAGRRTFFLARRTT